MDMNKLRRELDSIKGGMEDINTLLLETENTSKDMVQRLADLSSIANKGGIIRSIMTRATAGIPSVYQLMQQLSSVLLVFKYLVVARNADLKAEQEMIESLKKRESIQRRLYNLETSIKKDKKGELSFLEKEKFYKDASIKHLMKTMSLTEALNVTKKRFRGVQETARKADEKILSKSRRQFVKENFKGKNFDKSLGPIANMRRMFGKNLEAKAGILMADEEIGGMKKRRMGLTSEKTDARIRKTLIQTKLDKQSDTKSEITKLENRLEKSRVPGGRRTVERQVAALKAGLIPKEEIKELEKESDLVGELLSTLGESIEGLDADMQIAFKERSSVIKDSKLKGFKVSGAAGSRKFTDLGYFEKKQLQYQKFKKRIDDKLASVRKGLGTFFSRGNISLMLNTLKASFAFLGYALLVILGIGLIVYTMKRTGIWDKIAEFIKVKWPEFRIYFELIWQAATVIFEGFISYFKGIWNIIKGLYTGDNTLISKGLKLMLDGARKILEGTLVVLGALLGLYIKLLVTSLSIGIGTVLGKLGELKDAILDKAGNVGGGAVMGAVGTGLIVAGLAAAGIIATPALATVAAVMGVGAIGGMIYGGVKDHKENSAEGMVSGGTILGGGQFLVGENGPELVTLPGGTSVTNNTNTRSALGPTINVHVNGRLGASDQELNEIARKIGNKINIEMNRFNSRGYRA